MDAVTHSDREALDAWKQAIRALDAETYRVFCGGTYDAATAFELGAAVEAARLRCEQAFGARGTVASDSRLKSGQGNALQTSGRSAPTATPRRPGRAESTPS